jgi:hypothetical protein
VKVTSEEVGSAAKVLLTIFQAIHAAGPEGVPSGVLYAYVTGVLTLQQYQSCIELLKKQRCIEEKNHVLVSLVKPEDLTKPGGRPA